MENVNRCPDTSMVADERRREVGCDVAGTGAVSNSLADDIQIGSSTLATAVGLELASGDGLRDARLFLGMVREALFWGSESREDVGPAVDERG